MNNGLNEVKDPSLIYQKPPTLGGMAGRIVPRRGFPASAYGDGVGMDDINVRHKNKYHLNLGDSVGFLGEGSSKIINTAILGEVKFEFVFTSQIASCILGSSSVAGVPIFGSDNLSMNSRLRDANGTDATFGDSAGMSANQSEFHRRRAVYQNQTNGFTSGDTGVPTLQNYTDAHDGIRNAGAIATENALYSIRDVVLHIEALQFKTSDYYDVINRLVDSGNYKYHFKRYVLQTDSATTTRQIDYRLVVNSECLNYVLACFRPAGYDTLANPVNTLISSQSHGHTGVYQATFDNQVRCGLPYTFNNSKFFVRNGDKIARMGWKVDEVYFEPRTPQEMYIDNLRHWRNYKGNELTTPHKGLKNLYDFVQTYYTGILSFEVKSQDDDKTIYALRGLNTNGKAVAISCFTETQDSTFIATTGTNETGFSSIDLQPADACIPTFLISTTCCLELEGRRNVSIKY